METPKQDWTERFDEKFSDKGMVIKEGIPQIYATTKEAIKSFISDLLEQKEKDRYWEACTGCKDGHPSFWKTVVESPEWQLWEKEQSRRFSSQEMDDIFDVDECAECGHISPKHFSEFMKFITYIKK